MNQLTEPLTFTRAVRRDAKARLAIDGPSGCGKTYTALTAAAALADGQPIALIDTEHGSAALYADLFKFDTLRLDTNDPRRYMQAIKAAEAAGYAVIVIDSLSQAWEGEGGALDMLDKAAKRSTSGSAFNAWKDITPIQRALVEAMLSSPCHIIATMRSKMEYVQEKDERSGRTLIRKLGLAPVQRQGMEYEFQVVADMDSAHTLTISKTRCRLLDNAVVNCPTAAFFRPYADWLRSSAFADDDAAGAQHAGSQEVILPDEAEALPDMTHSSSERSWSAAQVHALLDAGHARNPHNAVAMLKLSALPADASPGLCARWAGLYRATRQKNPACDAARAAQMADALLKLTPGAEADADLAGGAADG